ncbi:MAG: DUF58 domain-containing protein [Anaerolineales bacterium]|nr:DUF58 domain-containing protein [Anaerolineales bacterium]
MVGLILFLLALAFFLRIDFVFYIIYVCLGVYAWSRWYTPRAFNRLAAARSYSQRAFFGETVTVTLRIRNDNRLAMPWVQVNESVATQLRQTQVVSDVVSLAAWDTAELAYQIKAARRGYYQIGPLRLTSSDLFGLLPEQYGILPADYLTIYPRIIPLAKLGLPSRLPFGTIASRQRLFEDPARPMGVREYRSGDSLRQINWKVSAHTRDLVVKTLQPAISLETAVLLNLHTPDYRRRDRQTYVEWAIQLAASLAAHLVDQRQAVGLLTNGIDPLVGQAGGPRFDEASGRLLLDETAAAPLPPPIPPRNGRAHLMKILERLARIEGGETVALADWVGAASTGLSWGVTILAITPRGDERTCHSLHRLVRAGFNPVLMVVEPDANFGEVRQRARRLGFVAYHVAAERDLGRWKRP